MSGTRVTCIERLVDLRLTDHKEMFVLYKRENRLWQGVGGDKAVSGAEYYFFPLTYLWQGLPSCLEGVWIVWLLVMMAIKELSFHIFMDDGKELIFIEYLVPICN